MKKKNLPFFDIEKVCQLAKIKLNFRQKKLFQSQLTETLNYIKILNRLKTVKIAPTAQVNKLSNIAREDETRLGLTLEEALSNAKGKYNNYFKVERIF